MALPSLQTATVGGVRARRSLIAHEPDFPQPRASKKEEEEEEEAMSSSQIPNQSIPLTNIDIHTFPL